MDLSGVIAELVEERGLDRDRVTDIVCQGIQSAYERKFPDRAFHVSVGSRSFSLAVEVEKTVATSLNSDSEISLRRAKVVNPKAKVGDIINVPFDESVGRVEVLLAKNIIAQGVKQLEQAAVYEEFHEKEGTLLTGTVHKKERAGYAVNIGDVVAFLPNSCSIPGEVLRTGFTIRVLLKEVLESTQGGYQIILDRASTDFVQRLLEAEIPEVFEGVVEVRKIVRSVGYKTKIALVSNSGEVDPVGTCVGVGGSRIKPILKELGREKIDLISWTENEDQLVRGCLKPAELEGVKVVGDGSVLVWLAEDQRSFAIGKMGQNITLASELSGLQIHLQESNSREEGGLFADDADAPECEGDQEDKEA